MTRLDATRTAVLIAVLAAGQAALAASYSLQLDIVFQGERLESLSVSGTEPRTLSLGPVYSSNAQRVGVVNASATHGRVSADASSGSNGGKVTSAGQARAVFDDVVFTYVGPGVSPGVVPSAALNISLAMTQTASGDLGSIGGFNARQMIWSASFMGFSAGGTITHDVNGNSGQGQLGQQRIEAMAVPIDAPVTIVMDVFVGAQATRRQANSPVNTTVAALMTVGRAQETLGPSFAESVHALPLSGPFVFDLPAGFTVNSPSMGIVDNRWVGSPAIPEPGSWVLMALGLGVLASRGWRRGTLARA